MTPDEQLFYTAMHDVAPLKTQARYHMSSQTPKQRSVISNPPHTYTKTADSNIDTPFHSNLSDNIDQTVTSEQPLRFNWNQLSNQQVKALRHGQLRIDAAVDLHGKTINQARSLLHQFIITAVNQHYKLLLAIHGKGCRTQSNLNPILKNMVNTWLPQLPQVRAFCSALPKHGGTGAVYIFLKQSK